MASKEIDLFDYKNLGMKIRRHRNEKEMSQEKLAEELNISRNHVSDIECGKAHPSLALIALIADSLDTTVSELMAKEETSEDGKASSIIMKTISSFDSGKAEFLLRILEPICEVLTEYSIH